MASGVSGALRALGALRPLGALDALGAFDALRPLGAFGPLGPLGAFRTLRTIRPCDALAAPRPAVAARLVPQHAVAELQAYAVAFRIRAADAQTVEA